MAIILADRCTNVLGGIIGSNRKRHERRQVMRIGDKVYIMERAAAGVQRGVIVACKWDFSDVIPKRYYVVRKTKDVTSIADVLTTAFYGNTGELDYYSSNSLVRVPDISTETTTDTNPKNQALKGGPKNDD